MEYFKKAKSVALTGSDNAGQARPQAMRRIRWGAGRKAAHVLAVAIFAGFAIEVALQTKTMSESALERAVASSVAMTELLASQISGGIQWKKSDVVGRSYRKLTADPQSDLSNLAAFHVGGDKVSEFSSDKLAKFNVTTGQVFSEYRSPVLAM